MRLSVIRAVVLVGQDGRERKERVIATSSGLADQDPARLTSRELAITVIARLACSCMDAALGRSNYVILIMLSPVPFTTEIRSANLGGSLSPNFDGQRDG